MTERKVPQRLWDFGLVYESELLSRMARENDCRNGHEEVTGQTHVEVYNLMCRTDHEAKFYGLFASISVMVWRIAQTRVRPEPVGS
jgi:hypothetical protein